jgi:3-deoxy-7-phosphoheptulonate synthase
MEMKAHRNGEGETSVTVGNVLIGAGAFTVMAGPCAIESEAQIMEAAEFIAEGGAAILRGGAFKIRRSPYDFQGLGLEALRYLRKAGDTYDLPVVSEVTEPDDVGVVAEHVDMVQVGASNMQNFVLLRAVGQIERPVLLKRGPSATIDEWLMAAEYILNEGNLDVVLGEQGIRTFDTRTASTLDISSIPVVKQLSHLPVIIDPSHASGASAIVAPLALAGRAAGADGLMVEVHPSPDDALTEGPHQLDRDEYLALMHALGIVRLRADIDLVDREIVRLLARRVKRAVEIARIKVEEGIPLRSPDREVDLLADVREEAERLGLDQKVVHRLFEEILDYSRFEQRRAVGVEEEGDPGL